MTGCTKKITRRHNQLAEDLVVDCDALADVVDIGAITVLICREHHVEIVEAVHPKLRRLRRLQTNVMALVAGYASDDVEIQDIEEAVDRVELCEDEIRAYVKEWMTKPKMTTEAV